MTNDPIVVICNAGLSASQLQRIRDVSPRIDLREVAGPLQNSASSLGDAEVLLSHFRNTGFDPSLAPKLRWIQLVSASVEAIFQQPIAHTGVAITNCSGIHAVPISEYVLTSMLAFARHLPELLRRQARNHWSTPPEIYESLVAGELRGAVLGVLGYGSIGREIARLGRSFGMRVFACKRDPAQKHDPGWCLPGVGDPEGSIPERFYGVEALHEFLARCDYVVVCCPLTPATKTIIDAAALQAMKLNAYLVNVGRGDLIDEAALLQALKTRQIAGAGLDVMSVEPLPSDSPFFPLDNVILTPHCSGTTPHYDDRATDLFCDNLRQYLNGETLWNTVSREARY